MKHYSISIILILAFILSFSCDKDEDSNLNICDKNVIVNNIEYENAPDDPLTILNAEIINNCLKIKFSASGCSGNTWEVKLVDSEKLYYSLPPQRKLRLSLKNDEHCKAVISKEYSFNIRDLQVNGGKLSLSIENYGDLILYEY